MFDTVLVAGLGLMGGSMAKTIKARTLSRVLGWNRTRATAEQALADGSIDAIATDALFREVDLVIIGLYPQATVDWLLENMPKMKKGCVIVDMVGVKQFTSDGRPRVLRPRLRPSHAVRRREHDLCADKEQQRTHPVSARGVFHVARLRPDRALHGRAA